MTQKAVSKRMGRAVAVAVEPLEDRRLLSATISLENLDGLPSTNNQMAFNRIQVTNPQINEVFHDTDTLRIHNTGDAALVINSLTLSDTTNWQLVNPPAAGTSIAPGGSADVKVKFVAQSVPPNQPVNETNDTMSSNNLPPSQTGGVWDGTLTIATNDPTTPSSVVKLAGYWQAQSENEEEPNLQTLVNRLFGYGTNIDSAQQPDYPNNGTTPVLYGEEVASGLWQAANPSQPITVRQLFAYHNEIAQNNGQDPAAFIAWQAQNSSTLHTIFTHAADNSQSLLPPLVNTTSTPAAGSFTPGGVFSWNLDGESSIDSANTTDINTFGRSGHADRFYPLRDSQGNLIPNTWLIAMDYQNGSFDNSDYQDNGYIVTNVRPNTQAPAPTNLQAAAANGQVNLTWTAVTDNALQGYNVYSSTSPTGPFTKLNPSLLTSANFTDTSPAGSTVYYEVSAVDTSGESERANAAVGAPSGTNGGGGGGGSGPDLTLGTVAGRFPSSVVNNARSGPLRVTLTNSGNQTAKGTVEIDVFASPVQDSVPSGATPLSRITRAINLKAGKSLPLAVPGFSYASVSGQTFIVAQVTALSGISESNTANNTGSSATAVNVAPAFVDLQNLFTGELPATLVPGKRTALQVPVINNGNVAAHGAATFTISASTNANGAGATVLSTQRVPVLLGPGKTARYNLRFLVPTLASGTYFVVSDVELPGDTVAANNVAVSSGTFTV